MVRRLADGVTRRPAVLRPGALAGAGLLLALAGCGGAPPPPPPTVIHLTLKAGPDANPGPDGTGAPVTLRVYQLAAQAGFNNAEFFPLYNADAATLGQDLVKRDDFPLSPGQSKTVTLTPNDPVKAIGVFAGLRDFRHGTWRAAADIAAHQTTDVTVSITKTGVTLKAVPQPPPKS